LSLFLFLEGQLPDSKGRYLQDILNFSDYEIENTHDFIQWVFPLAEASRSNFTAPVLEKFEIEEIRSSNVAKINIINASQWYLSFLKRQNHWIRDYDHNHLRITRVIKSLRLLVSNETADSFYDDIKHQLRDHIYNINEKAVRFWNNA
jgi:hypothetical protein